MFDCGMKLLINESCTILESFNFRHPDFIAPCLGVHPVQSLCPDRSATLEVCLETSVLFYRYSNT